MTFTNESIGGRKLALSINQASDATSLSVPFLRKEIYAGNLKAHKVGTRTLVFVNDLVEYIGRGALASQGTTNDETLADDN